MTRRALIAGNWKMNGTLAALVELDAIALAAGGRPDVDVAVCPPFTLIAAAAARQPGIAIGAQDCHWEVAGAHTGCIATSMIAEVGARYVIVGHSERRADNHETSDEVGRNAGAVQLAGMTAILCVGETEAIRDAGEAVAFVVAQLGESLPNEAAHLVIAYEPVWAIGTGRTPTVDDIAEMHGAIRAALTDRFGSLAGAVRILYGGSVKPSNATEILGLADVDGALVGGASLKASDFTPIIAVA